ncbi:hypothetical protein E4U22_005154, partial [Claviceps purpurea]
ARGTSGRRQREACHTASHHSDSPQELHAYVVETGKVNDTRCVSVAIPLITSTVPPTS